MKQLVFLLEEPLMREVLQIVLPQLLPPEINFLLIAHEGKRDLEASIVRKLRAWQNQPSLVCYSARSRCC